MHWPVCLVSLLALGASITCVVSVFLVISDLQSIESEMHEEMVEFRVLSAATLQEVHSVNDQFLNGAVPINQYDDVRRAFKIRKRSISSCQCGVQSRGYPVGPPGLPGPDGIVGLEGLQGEEGRHGTTGISLQVTHSYPGGCIQCPEGLPGLPGGTGLTGPAGVPGGRGDPGVSGTPGIPGDEGECGEMGDPGNDGREGRKGRPGIPGLIYELGARGQPGQEGSCGVLGHPGKDGEPGAAGKLGDMGPKGAEGYPGEDGDNGSDGIPGVDGQSGRDSNYCPCPKDRYRSDYDMPVQPIRMESRIRVEPVPKLLMVTSGYTNPVFVQETPTVPSYRKPALIDGETEPALNRPRIAPGVVDYETGAGSKPVVAPISDYLPRRIPMRPKETKTHPQYENLNPIVTVPGTRAEGNIYTSNSEKQKANEERLSMMLPEYIEPEQFTQPYPEEPRTLPTTTTTTATMMSTTTTTTVNYDEAALSTTPQGAYQPKSAPTYESPTSGTVNIPIPPKTHRLPASEKPTVTNYDNQISKDLTTTAPTYSDNQEPTTGGYEITTQKPPSYDQPMNTEGSVYGPSTDSIYELNKEYVQDSVAPDTNPHGTTKNSSTSQYDMKLLDALQETPSEYSPSEDGTDYIDDASEFSEMHRPGQVPPANYKSQRKSQRMKRKQMRKHTVPPQTPPPEPSEEVEYSQSYESVEETKEHRDNKRVQNPESGDMKKAASVLPAPPPKTETPTPTKRMNFHYWHHSS